MKKVLVTGAKGQLGQALYAITGEHEQFIFTDIEELDINDTSLIEPLFYTNNIIAVINCAAYTAVDKAETERELAFKVNRDAVKNLVKVCNQYGSLLVHISTDYVFDGNHNIPYTEEDQPNPQSVYGRSKLEGENIINQIAKNAIIIRSSWLYSEYGKNFVKTILNKSAETEVLQVVFDQVGTPTYAGDLAEFIIHLLNSEYEGVALYHFSNEGVCSWYDFAKAIVQISGNECEVEPILTKDFPTAAKRPAYSILDKSKVKEEHGIVIPYWRDSLELCMKNLVNEQKTENED
jgi:dTDP-4-dehydrorhamnose reductase